MLVEAPHRETADESLPAERTRWPVVVAAAATALAGVLALADAADKSLWYDEAFTVGLVSRPFGDALWRIVHWELNQSPYYVLMLGWQRLGDGDAFLRAVAGVCTVATVPLVFALGRRLADAWTGAIAAAVFAGHGLVVEWSQQVRGYALATLLVTAAALLLVRAVEDPTPRRAIAFAVVTVAAAYTHVLSLLVVAAELLVVALYVRPIPWRATRVAGITGAVLLAPLGWYYLTRTGDPLSWIGEPSGIELRDTLADVAGGGIRHLVVLGALAAVAAWAAWRAPAARRWRALLPVAMLVLPVAAVVGSTYTVKPLLVDRYLLMTVPALAILVAMGVRSLPAPAAAVAGVAVAVVSYQGVRDWYATPTYEDWRAATAAVAAGYEPGDDVTVLPGRAVHAVRHYGPELPTVSPSALAGAAGERLWVLERLSQTGTEGPFPHEFIEELSNYEVVDQLDFTNVAVRLYERR